MMSNLGSVCPTCKGRGRIRVQQSWFSVERSCPTCVPGAQESAKTSSSRSGYVYILHMAAGILKIGHTARHPKDRAEEWQLELLAYARCEDSADAERRLHQHLRDYRKGAYELFEVSFGDALRALEQVVGSATVVRKP
jgi:hypothetical protein